MLETVPDRKSGRRSRRLKTYIQSEKLVSGDRLPTETELAEMFGVSRLSLREATKALEFLGIIESRTGVGLTVGRIDLERVTDHLGFHPALRRRSAAVDRVAHRRRSGSAASRREANGGRRHDPRVSAVDR